jgi:type IV fimbrial biogenesis protein FimT
MLDYKQGWIVLIICSKSVPLSLQRGLTLPELLIGIAILGILASVGLPSFQTWMVDTKIRTATESIQNGLQRARAEAVARNTGIEFVLGAGSSWVVSVANPVTIIESRSSSEGSKNVTGTPLPALATTLTYNSFGQVTPNADATASLTQVTLAASGSNKRLSITINAGGSTKMCNPDLTAGSHITAC